VDHGWGNQKQHFLKSKSLELKRRKEVTKSDVMLDVVNDFAATQWNTRLLLMQFKQT
jgi:hypothetical protein